MGTNIIVYLSLWFFIGISISHCLTRKYYPAEGQSQFFTTEALETVLESDLSNDVHPTNAHPSNPKATPDHPSKANGDWSGSLKPDEDTEVSACFGTCSCHLIEDATTSAEHKDKWRGASNILTKYPRHQTEATLSVSCSNLGPFGNRKSKAILDPSDWLFNVSAVLINGTHFQNLPPGLCEIESDILHLTWTRSNLDLGQDISGSNLLQCFPNLLSLHLTNNIGLSFLHLGILDNLPKQLQSLVLQDNNISVIHEALSDNLQELRTLDLSQNALEELDTKVFSSLTSLRQLYLSRNNIRVISSENVDVFWNKLELLDLSHNALNRLPSIFPPDPLLLTRRGIFKSHWRLLFLNLSHNLLEHLHVGAFDLATNLLHLDLSFNYLYTITAGTFTPALANLLTLQLSHNRISYLSPRAFEGLASLRALNVSFNQLTGVQGEEFSGGLTPNLADVVGNAAVNYTSAWRDLQTVDLSHNNISHISRQAFQVILSHCMNLYRFS